MKLCHNCGQALADSIDICPSCGHEVTGGLRYIDDYRILEIVYEGNASIVCRAIREQEDTEVALRLFKADSGVDENVAQRLKKELEELKKLPEEWFVRHDAIFRSSDGLWYRVSEWLEAESWGDLLSSGRLRDLDVAYDLFHRLAAILDGLHKSGHFIPHLILNDILVLKGEHGRVDVKIDYKLSRFLDPKMARPGPLLQNLLDCHPDIERGRPFNIKSDVWSLGRIFTQILTADMELCDPVPAIREGCFPKELSILIRSMLADDPDLRPRSMSEVADALNRIKEEHFKQKKPSRKGAAREIRKLRKTILLISALAVVLSVVGGLFLYQLDREPADLETVFAEYADAYAASVAFMVVEYQILVDEDVLYRQRTEGTAFLVDPEGYLLTNRHVSCPWLEDEAMYKVISYVKNADKIPRFDYQIYLWFEGEIAFNRLIGIGESEELEDVYDLHSAYSRSGSKTVEIMGVAKAPVGRGQMVRAPLRDDFSVLKIAPLPKGLKPLPLDRELDSTTLKRLSPVMALGFPLGRTSQVDVINVSVTKGHIRRTFENFFQVDTSIYKGNSGGPIIDSRGKVIGIVSAVATDVAVAPLPVITHLSDIGLVLPVTKVAEFIDELKEGRPKWNGSLDLSANAKIKEITDTALSGKWSLAEEQIDLSLLKSDDPSLVFTAAMIHYCTGDLDGSGNLFDRVLSIDPENHQALLMRYIIDMKRGGWTTTIQPRKLLSMDWRSPGEFFGHLARILQKSGIRGSTLDSWNSPAEKGWVYFVAGLIQQEKVSGAAALPLLKTAARVSKRDEWPIFLALSELDSIWRNSLDGELGEADFRLELKEVEEERRQRAEKSGELLSQFEEAAADPNARREVLLQLNALDPENKKLLAYAAFYGAMASEWNLALQTAEKYLLLNGREEALRLGIRLLIPGILRQMGKEKEALERLVELLGITESPWHQEIIRTLLNEQPENDLIDMAGNVPEKILTAYTALGLRAEAADNRNLAIQYYREALGSYLDNWAEFELARQRYIGLRDQGSR